MLRPQKDTNIEKLTQALSSSAGAVFLDFTGLTVAEADGFRRTLRGTGIHYQVVKNTLVARALEASGNTGAQALLKGSPTGLVWGGDDPVAVAKAALSYVDTCEHLKVKGGVVDAKAISAADTVALSKMANKAQTQAAVVALARSPERTLLGAVGAPGANVAGAVAALVTRLEEKPAA